MLRSIGLLMLCLCTFVACAKNTPEATPSPTPKVDLEKLERESSKRVRSHVTLEASGDVSVDYDAETDLRIVTFDRGPQFATTRLLSIGMEKFASTGDNAKIRAYVDLVGFDVKPGNYTVPKSNTGQANPNPAASGGVEAARALSKAYLSYYEVEGSKVGKASEFQRVVEPCSLEVGEKAQSGKLACPKLADASGKTIELSMEWEAV